MTLTSLLAQGFQSKVLSFRERFLFPSYINTVYCIISKKATDSLKFVRNMFKLSHT